MTRKWLVASAGTNVVVEGPDRLAAWWPVLAPQIPGTAKGPLREGTGPSTLSIADGVTRLDARRRINASLHAAHLTNDTLSLHAVALTNGHLVVVLLGGHGAGKSLTGLAMIRDLGWQPVAGDVCLVEVEKAGEPWVRGGTRSYTVRRPDTHRWFPGFAMPSRDGDQVELSEELPRPRGEPPMLLVGLALVSIDGIDHAARRLPRSGNVAANALYRASRHLIDRVLDDPAEDPLSLVEGPELTRRRLGLVRRLAATTECRWLRGTPQGMATKVVEMADGGRGWEG